MTLSETALHRVMRTFRDSIPFALALVFATSSGAQADVAADPDTAPVAATASAAAETAAAAEPGAKTEPAEDEVDWLVDEATGIFYRVDQIDKVEGTFSRPKEGWVRFPGGGAYQLIDEDESHFWIKRFKPGQWEVRRPRRDPAKQLGAGWIDDTPVLESVDRIALDEYDQGLPRRGQWRNGFDLADMNGDGHLDIVFGSRRKSSGGPSIFLGDGKGGWQRWAEMTLPQAPYDYGDVVAADWNADGIQDLAFGVHLRGILVLVGDGKGGFALWSDGIDIDVAGGGAAAPDAFSSRALAATDWDRDGRVDLVAYGEGPKPARQMGQMGAESRGLMVFLNQGDGHWTPRRVNRDRNFGDGLLLVDLDSDGDDDVVVSSSQVGSFGAIYRRTAQYETTVENLDALRGNGLVDGLAKGDFDGDGKVDLALAYRS